MTMPKPKKKLPPKKLKDPFATELDEFPLKVSPNPFLELEQASMAAISTATPTTLKAEDIYNSAVKAIKFGDIYNSAVKAIKFGELQIGSYTVSSGPVEFAPFMGTKAAVPQALTADEKVGADGKKVAPSVVKLKAQVIELMGMVVDLTHKLEKAVGVAETAYSMAKVHEQTIAKLQNQLMSHYHPPPTVQVNGMYLAMPNGQLPVITG